MFEELGQLALIEAFHVLVLIVIGRTSGPIALLCAVGRAGSCLVRLRMHVSSESACFRAISIKQVLLLNRPNVQDLVD